MYPLSSIISESLCCLVVLLPLLLIFKGRLFPNLTKGSVVFMIILAVFLTAAFSATGIPTVYSVIMGYGMDFNIHVIPITDIVYGFGQFGLNVLLFLPLGFLLPLVWSEFKSGVVTTLYGFCLSLFIEIAQIFTYRATDIDDLIANTLGAFAGWVLVRLISHVTPIKLAVGEGRGFPKGALILTLITFGVMFLVQPFISNFVWWVFY